ncbi:Ben and cat operon transcriptional regulator [Serratia fonticola]|uniref:LysR substrate-binding domain-containing protein n=1 Tax=Serratia TaxID=613 RepID=UPI00080FAA7C|nr:MULTISPECIES: LysR family transcriptional regulator [Serratia]MBC3219468.1 LysR family transcriptional regulator [Serratia fonticola]NBJ34094.1 LysR family transcriptional regulator [Serratia fonticola]OCJ36495.1 hypothetical protein A6U95_25605 [Serratia sp. 14-2641]CAI1973369.1 Ben and cat operon transcriptional regulator [Serratia fonticola]
MKNNLSIRSASLRDFEIIKAIIEKGSATQAAESLGISQPAVSKAVASIEEKLGKTLFTREKGRLNPTKDALFFYEEIVNIFNSLERIDDNNWASKSSKTLKVITTPTIAYSYLAPLTARYAKERSNVKVSFSVVNSVDMMNLLREGRADIALANADINNNLAELTIEPIFKSKIVCMMHKNHELAKKEKLVLSDFNFRNIIMYTTRNILFSKIMKAFSGSGVETNVIAEVSDSLVALNFVNENLGLCLVPNFPVIHQFNDNIIVKDIDVEIYDEMAFFYLPNILNPYCSDYVEYVTDHLQSIQHLSK